MRSICDPNCAHYTPSRVLAGFTFCISAMQFLATTDDVPLPHHKCCSQWCTHIPPIPMPPTSCMLPGEDAELGDVPDELAYAKHMRPTCCPYVSLFAFVPCSSLQQLMMCHCHTTSVVVGGAHISPLYPCPPRLACCRGRMLSWEMSPMTHRICEAYATHMSPTCYSIFCSCYFLQYHSCNGVPWLQWQARTAMKFRMPGHMLGSTCHDLHLTLVFLRLFLLGFETRICEAYASHIEFFFCPCYILRYDVCNGVPCQQ